MLVHYAAFVLATALIIGMPPSQPCRAALDFVIAKTEADYSGFRDKVASGTEAAYTALTAATRGRADTTTTNGPCLALLNDWLHFFHDGHLAVRLSPTAPGVRAAAKTLSSPRAKAFVAFITARGWPRGLFQPVRLTSAP